MANGTIAASQLEMLSLSGTGIITITPPATNTNRAITLPDAAGAIVVSGTTPSLNGITFPATQVSSADANTLDDYEEGTFTAGIRGASTAGTYTTSGQVSSYTKIGRLVSLTIGIPGFSAASGGTAYMQITGLPFTNTFASKGALSGDLLNYSASTLFAVPAFINSSGVSTLYLEENKDNANRADFDISGISTSTAILITITYSTS